MVVLSDIFPPLFRITERNAQATSGFFFEKLSNITFNCDIESSVIIITAFDSIRLKCFEIYFEGCWRKGHIVELLIKRYNCFVSIVK